jgi:PTS system fructose-specific IIC component
MGLNNLTNENLILLDLEAQSKIEVIEKLVNLLDKEGILISKDNFFNAVLEREKISPTGLEEGLAIPHGKSETVRKATFAVARLKKPILEWESIDEDNEVNLVFLLAIPKSEEGDTHIEVLTNLTSLFMKDGFIEALQNAKTEKEIIDILGTEKENEFKKVEYSEDAKIIIAITACATGIAHTYLAADALEKAGEKLDIKIYAEKQGANGIEGAPSEDIIKKADGLIIATDVAPKNLERFAGLPFIKTRVAAPLKDAEGLINKVLDNPDGIMEGDPTTAKETTTTGTGLASDIKRHFMTGVSYMIPLVIAGAVIMGIARIGGSIFDVKDIWDASHMDSGNALVKLFHIMDGIGGRALGLMLPFIAGFIAFSVSDKAGLVPGFIGGLLAKELNTGFLGALIAGLIAGYCVKWILKNIKLPGFASGITAIFIAPVLGTLITALAMLYIVGDPLAIMNKGLETWLMGLSGGNKLIMAAIIGGMVGFDLGGPVNKAAVTTAMALLASGITAPNTAAQVAIIVPPIGLGLATVLGKTKYNLALQEAGKSSILMGLVGISEGAIPFAIESPLKVIPVTVIGSAIASAMAVGLSANNPAPISGFYGWFAVENWPLYVLSIFTGSIFIAVTSVALRKKEA